MHLVEDEAVDKKPIPQQERPKREIKKPVRYGYKEYANPAVTDDELKAVQYSEPNTPEGALSI